MSSPHQPPASTTGDAAAQYLVVLAHPLRSSLTHAVSGAVVQELEAQGHRVELADLAAERFDPVFGPADHAAYSGHGAVPADVVAEQARIDRADHLVLIFPVYWWSMPALLKGWIDRVFISGWAFDVSADDGEGSRIVKKLGDLTVHILAFGEADGGTYAQRGYRDAMATQIDRGIFDFCGAPVATSHVLTAPADGAQVDHVAAARSLAHDIAQRGKVALPV